MQRISFNREWQFNLIEPRFFPWGPEDTSSWRKLDLPHDWSIELARSADNPSSNLGGYFQNGFGWYRKEFEVPADWQGKTVLVEFEGVFMNAEVFINDRPLGVHPYGYTTFTYDLSPYLNYGGKNDIRVAVDNSHPLNARWYTGSGIYRPVWLHVGEAVHLAHWGVFVTTPDIQAEAATICVKTKAVNSTTREQIRTLTTRVISPEGLIVSEASSVVSMKAGSESEFSQEMIVLDPLLWAPDSPHLYHLESCLQKDGEDEDKKVTVFGIRSLEFSPEHGFLMNGVPYKLLGGCVHHDNGILGAASYPGSERRKVMELKRSGFNAIRCAHNPPSTAFLDACDQAGMLVMDEAFDVWRQGKNPGDYHLYFDDWWQRDLDSMVLRDRNHPSIILWSIGNELLERVKPEGVEIARTLVDRIRQMDDTRPITAAINGGNEAWDWEKADEIFSVLDVCGYNYQWKDYENDHKRHPSRMIIGTESTAGEALENWLLVRENAYILGDFVWTSLDYLGESGIGREILDGEPDRFLPTYPWHQANCGDLDICGFKRPQSYYRDILWERGEKLYLGVHAPVTGASVSRLSFWGWEDVWHSWNWEGHEGENVSVVVYSGFDEVELFLNGASQGRKPTTQNERFTAHFERILPTGLFESGGIREPDGGL